MGSDVSRSNDIMGIEAPTYDCHQQYRERVLQCVTLRTGLRISKTHNGHDRLQAKSSNGNITGQHHVFLVKVSCMYTRAGHIDTRVYRIRELATGATPEVRLYKIAGEDQLSDIFTKGLPRPACEKHRAVFMGEMP